MYRIKRVMSQQGNTKTAELGPVKCDPISGSGTYTDIVHSREIILISKSSYHIDSIVCCFYDA